MELLLIPEKLLSESETVREYLDNMKVYKEVCRVDRDVVLAAVWTVFYENKPSEKSEIHAVIVDLLKFTYYAKRFEKLVVFAVEDAESGKIRIMHSPLSVSYPNRALIGDLIRCTYVIYVEPDIARKVLEKIEEFSKSFKKVVFSIDSRDRFIFTALRGLLYGGEDKIEEISNIEFEDFEVNAYDYGYEKSFVAVIHVNPSIKSYASAVTFITHPEVLNTEVDELKPLISLLTKIVLYDGLKSRSSSRVAVELFSDSFSPNLGINPYVSEVEDCVDLCAANLCITVDVSKTLIQNLHEVIRLAYSNYDERAKLKEFMPKVLYVLTVAVLRKLAEKDPELAVVFVKKAKKLLPSLTQLLELFNEVGAPIPSGLLTADKMFIEQYKKLISLALVLALLARNKEERIRVLEYVNLNREVSWFTNKHAIKELRRFLKVAPEEVRETVINNLIKTDANSVYRIVEEAFITLTRLYPVYKAAKMLKKKEKIPVYVKLIGASIYVKIGKGKRLSTSKFYKAVELMRELGLKFDQENKTWYISVY